MAGLAVYIVGNNRNPEQCCTKAMYIGVLFIFPFLAIYMMILWQLA